MSAPDPYDLKGVRVFDHELEETFTIKKIIRRGSSPDFFGVCKYESGHEAHIHYLALNLERRFERADKVVARTVDD